MGGLLPSNVAQNLGQTVIYALIALCGIAAGTVSGIVGTGSSIILLPVLSLAFGPKAAIPIMAIASICLLYTSRCV